MRDPMGIPHEPKERDSVEYLLILAGKTMAVSGGLLFIALVIMSLVSIIGRKLGFGSVNGDIELMQVGTAVAAVSFLPYCTLLGEHIKVDFFTEGVRPAIKRRLDGMADLLLAVVSGLLAWRTVLATLDSYESQEVTSLVSLPMWIPIMLLVPGLSLMSVSALYRAFLSLNPSKPMPEKKR